MIARRIRRARDIHGEIVIAVLFEVAPRLIKKAELIERTGLTASQVYNGIIWIREEGAGREGRPFIWSRRTGYGFPDESSEWSNFERRDMLQSLNRHIRLLRGTVDPHLAQEPGDRLVRLLANQLTGIISTLEFATGRSVPPG